jgi:NitT/TauT family transport system substrate-binding protein
MTVGTCFKRLQAATVTLLAGALLAAPTPTVAQTPALKTIRYVFALPTMSLVTANQTSIPTLLGYYKEEGLSIDPVAAGTGGSSAAAQLVASGQQDVGSGTQSPLVARAADGQDMGLVFFYNQIRDFHYVIGVRDESDITDVKQLRGKSVGVSTLASEAVVTGRYFARSAGLDPAKDVNFVAIGAAAQALHAIRSGRVDAYSNLHAAFAPMEVLGQKFRYLPLPPGTKDVFGPGLFVRRDYLDKNRQTLNGIGRAVAKSTLFVLNNPEAAVRLHWKMYPEQMPKGIPEEQALKDGIRVFEIQSQGLRFADHEPKLWGNYLPESWTAYINIYELSDKLRDPTRFYTNDLVKEINNFDQQKVIEQAKTFRMP